MHSNTSGFLNSTNAKNILTELAEFPERLIDKAWDPGPAGRHRRAGGAAPGRRRPAQRGGGGGGRRCGCAPGWGIAAPVSQPGPASVVLGQLLPCGPGVEASCPTGPASPPGAEEGGVSRPGLSVDGGLESRSGVAGCSGEHGVGRLDLGEWEGRRGTGGGGRRAVGDGHLGAGGGGGGLLARAQGSH